MSSRKMQVILSTPPGRRIAMNFCERQVANKLSETVADQKNSFSEHPGKDATACTRKFPAHLPEDEFC
jgi:hypothetical protein